jgi:hypothetical protein
MYMKTKDEHKKSDGQTQAFGTGCQGISKECAHGKRPLTRLATLATLSPRERAVDGFVFRYAKIEGTKPECI